MIYCIFAAGFPYFTLIHYSTAATMIKIFDEQRCLNLNHLAIYLMLTSDEMALYGDKLEGLNRFSSLTKGVFRFAIVEKGETPYDKLPKEMIRNMRHYNVMARLVDSIHDIYCYGLDEIDLEGDKSSIHEQLKVFVEQVCKENIDHLDILYHRLSHSSRIKMRYYFDEDIVKELFEAALKGENAGNNNCKSVFQGSFISLDLKSSLEIAKSAADSKKEQMDLKIEKERCEREVPDYKPQISITVKNIVKTNDNNPKGRLKKKPGVELNIDGNIVPVVFDSTDQTFLYIIIIMARKEGCIIRRSDFMHIEENPNDNIKELLLRNSMNIWIKKRYQALGFKRDFEDWCRAIKNDIHRMDDAASKIKRKLWERLCSKYKNAYFYCVIHNKYKFYDIPINGKDISIDPKIMELIDED